MKQLMTLFALGLFVVSTVQADAYTAEVAASRATVKQIDWRLKYGLDGDGAKNLEPI